ncbi:MAG: gliding motility protein GldM [Bacteroidales bacterium]
MGATNCPETPRQKMIGMMYLVLTAMLALNVSKDILDAFAVVDETLVTSTENTEGKNATDYSFLEKQQAILGEAKTKEAVTKAQILKAKTDEMVNYIENLKKEMIIFVDGSDVDEDGNPKTVKTIQAKDDSSKPSQFMINEGRAKKLKDKIVQYKKDILALVTNDSERKRIEKTMGLNVEETFKDKDGGKESWESHSFQGTIMAAGVTLLNKTVGEVRNTESTILNYITNSINADDFKFNEVGGKAIPKSQMVFSGDSYEADIIVAAYDTKQTPEVYYKMGVDTLTEAALGGATKLEGEAGLVKLKLSTGGIGEQKYAGLIKIKAPDGTDRYYGFSDKYTVLQPSATVAAEKMNVLYAGIANPVSVSAPVAPDKLRLNFAGCTATATGGGKYNISVPTSLIGKPVTATISADMGGKTQALGTSTFRVKRVPDPRATIGANIKGGKRTKQEILANPYVRATMGEDFVYDLKWNVNSFRVVFVSKGYEDPPIACAGGTFSESVKAKIQRASSNTVIYFTDIKATSEAGSRTLDEISVRIK